MRPWVMCVLASGCFGSGGGYCDHVADYLEDCDTTTVTDGYLDTCEESVANCTADEEDALIDFFDCIVEFSGCEAMDGTTTSSSFEALACFAEVADVSPECLGITATLPSSSPAQ